MYFSYNTLYQDNRSYRRRIIGRIDSSKIKKDKQKLVIEMYENGKTTRQIAKELRMSLRYRYHIKRIQ